MTKRDWKVGERCWCDYYGVKRGKIVAIGKGRAALLFDGGEVGLAFLEALSESKAEAQLETAIGDVERLNLHCAEVEDDLRHTKGRATRAVKALAKAEKRLAALRAKVKP